MTKAGSAANGLVTEGAGFRAPRPFFFCGRTRRSLPDSSPGFALFASSITNFKTASPLALNDDVALLRHKFDLANVTASGIDLLRNRGRAPRASASFAPRNVAASVDANRCRRGIKIGLQHTSGARVAQFQVTMLMSVISA